MNSTNEYKTLPNSAGVIGFSRVSGTASLYGFPFEVPGFIRLTISTAKEKRYLSNTWRYADKELIEVDLSYSQFAEAITTMNGSGNTACTVRYLQGQKMEDVHLPNERQEFNAELQQTLEDAVSSLQEALNEVDSANITKKAKEAIKSKIRASYMKLTDSAPFVVKQYAERMDDITTEAKIEFAAYCDQAVRANGLEAIQTLNLLKPQD